MSYVQFEKKAQKRILSGLLCVCLLAAILLQVSPVKAESKASVTFEQLNASEVFLKQSQAGVCTLTSAAMMVRRAAMLSGNQDWKDITESSVRRTAWTGSGLKWNFTSAGIKVTHKNLSGKSELIQMLGVHPEGVVIYNPRRPHAILITDYTDGVFYSSDPSNGSPSGRYPVSRASISVESATRCWYVTYPNKLAVLEESGLDIVAFDEPEDAEPESFEKGNLSYELFDESANTVICTGMVGATTKVAVPETVTYQKKTYKVVAIGERAFADSEVLKTAVIGKNVEQIGSQVFEGCEKLKKVTVANEGQKSMLEVAEISEDVTIVVSK